jgi:hypothetical protein
MYPSVPGVNDPPRAPYGAYGNNSVPSTPQYAAGAGPSSLTSAQSLESPWGTDSSSILRVKIADDYKLDAPVRLLMHQKCTQQLVSKESQFRLHA